MKTLIAANWKMQGNLSWVQKPAEFRALFAQSDDNIDVLLCPPTHMLAALVRACEGLNISVGAQNCHDQASGAFTGEISSEMVAQTGAKYVILGHSERRAMFGDTDKWVAAKTTAAQVAGLRPIVCVGESLTQREAGQAEEIVGKQLAGSLPKNADPDNLVIAYEPVWAIGTGLTPTLEDIATIHDHIRGLLSAQFDAKSAQNIQILYGGSVNPKNAQDILTLADVGGALIGGASLEMQSLAAIAGAAK